MIRFQRCSEPRSRPRRPGAAAVEFAAVAWVFFLIILGIFELGRLLMVQHLMTNAARVGCRAGVLQGVSSGTIITTTTQALAAQGVGSTQASVQVNDGSTDAANAKSGDEITVVVTVPMSDVSWVPAPRYLAGSVTARYTLRRE